MKKVIILSLFALILMLSACDIQIPPESISPSETAQQTTATITTATATATPTEKPLSISDYFPFMENVHKEYLGEGNEFAEFETYVEYLNNGAMQIRTINPGTESVSVYVIEDGALKRVFQAGETYYRLDYTSSRETEEILIKEPLAVGNSWVLEDGSTRSITSTNAPVTVPYGTFEALEVTTVGEYSTEKDYYVSGIGLIKREFLSTESGSSNISSSLETVETDVPFEQTIRLFYPDFNNDRLVYIEKTAQLYTGDSIADVFEQQLRQVPENSGLSPLLSANASIQGIQYDRETAIVSVDFSSEFISEMNAGSSLESMILSSVADTFGYYFQTNKVAITIEGKAYNSGHIVIEKGEYLTADWTDVPAY